MRILRVFGFSLLCAAAFLLVFGLLAVGLMLIVGALFFEVDPSVTEVARHLLMAASGVVLWAFAGTILIVAAA